MISQIPTHTNTTAWQVLFVGNDPAIVQQIQAILLDNQNPQASLIQVASINAALERLQQDEIDIILFDLCLISRGKKTEGVQESEKSDYPLEIHDTIQAQWLDAIARLQEYSGESPTHAEIPIVVLGAAEDETLAFQLIQAGVQDYLIKGEFDNSQLMRSLRYAIARQQVRNQENQGVEKKQRWEDKDEFYHSLIPKFKSLIPDENGNGQYTQPPSNQLEFACQCDADKISENFQILAPPLHLPEHQQQRFFNLSMNLLCIAGFDGYFKQLNPVWETTLGYSISELLSQPYLNFVHPDDQDATQQQAQKLINNSVSTINFENRYRCKDGSYRWLLWSATPVVEEGLIYTVAHDITARKQTEEKLHLLERAIAAASNGIVITDAQAPDHPLVYVNPSFKRMTGYSPAELLGQNCRFLQRQDTHQPELQEIRQALREKRDCHVTLRNYRKDGTLFWNNVSISPVRDSDGNVTHFIGVQRDITALKQAEAALSQSEARFQKLTETIPGVIYQYYQYPDGSHQFTYISSGVRELFELEPEAVQDNPQLIWDRIHPDDYSAYVASINHSAKTLESWCMKWRILTSSGTIRWCQGKAKPMRLSDGTLIWDGIILDITQRQHIKAKLQKVADTNQALLDAIPDMMFRYRADGTFVDFKPAQSIVPVAPPEVFIGKKPQDILPPDVAQRLQQASQQAILSGQLQTCEYQLTINGQLSAYEARIIACNPNEIIAIVRDITLRKHAEAEIIRARDLWQAIFNESADAIFLVDPDTLLTLDCNQRAIELFEVTNKAELLNIEGQTLQKEPFHPDDLDSIVDEIQMYGFWSREIEYVSKKGRLFWGNLAVKRIQVADKTLHLVRVTDITPRKQAESDLRLSEAKLREKAETLELTISELKQTQVQLIHQEKMASLGQLVAGIAHEINNPVSFIAGNINPARMYIRDLLQLIYLYGQFYPTPPQEIQDYIVERELDFIEQDFVKLLNSMQEGAARIQGIVQSLRNFSRLDESDYKKADIHQGIESTLMILQHRLRKQPNRAAIRVMREYDDLPLINCYPGDLNQVFINILSNAIDALEERMQQDKLFVPKIRICTDLITIQEQPDIHKIIILITDNGVGIDHQIKPRIFDPFFTTKTIGQGTGLGLSVAHTSIVQRHQGEIHCKSLLGQGTEFVIELPV